MTDDAARHSAPGGIGYAAPLRMGPDVVLCVGPDVVLCVGSGAQLAAVLQDQGTKLLSQRMACGSKHP
jgi:hypothetical protein